MKKVFAFFALTAFVLSMGLTSCSNEDPASELVVNTGKSATINGIAHAKLDATSSDTQYAPSGTKVFLKTAYSNLIPGGSTTDYYVVETTIGDKGAFSVSVPVSDKGTVYSIQGNEFTTTKKESSTQSGTYKYSAAAIDSPSLQVGATGYVTFDYTDGAYK